MKTLHEKETAEKQIAEKMRACHFDIVAFTAIEKAVTDLEKVQTRYNELARQAGTGRRDPDTTDRRKNTDHRK